MANKRSTSKDKARARYLKRHNGSTYPDDIVDELKRHNRQSQQIRIRSRYEMTDAATATGIYDHGY